MKELTFMDVAVLKKINKDTIMEKFGSKINSSFFDTANIVSSLKLKGYVDIEPILGGSKITITKEGEEILSAAEEKAKEEIDKLDTGILEIISEKVRDVNKIAEELNIRSGDLALHLYKLNKQGYIDYKLREGKIEVFFTEKGFNLVGRRKKVEESETGESILDEIAPEEEFKLNRWTRIKTKIRCNWILYVVILLLIIAILAVVYLWVYA